jgi:hypothetical protein
MPTLPSSSQTQADLKALNDIIESAESSAVIFAETGK